MKSLFVPLIILLSQSVFAASASVECIRYVYSDVGYNSAKAAMACNGKPIN